MKNDTPMAQLLRWRLTQAEADAPPAPAARQLLEQARPWWETLPEQFHALVGQLGKIKIAYGHAMTRNNQAQGGHPVPVLINRPAGKLETSARVLYLNVRDGRLRLRIQLAAAGANAAHSFEATFVTDDLRPLFSTSATLSVDSEYHLDVELPEELSRDWKHLKVTDRMPFRLIVRSEQIS